MLWICIWVHHYPFTLTMMPPIRVFWASPGWLQNDWMKSCKPVSTALDIHIKWEESDWALLYAVDMHRYTVSMLQKMALNPDEDGPDYGILDQHGCKKMGWCITEAVNQFRLFPISIIDLWRVFEHFHMLWICMWAYPYPVTWIKNRYLGPAQHGCKMKGWCHRWGFKPDPNALDIHIRFVKSV